MVGMIHFRLALRITTYIYLIIYSCDPFQSFAFPISPGIAFRNVHLSNAVGIYGATPEGSELANTESNTSIESELDSISDAEALLACYNYLQKRKRWGPWSKAEARKVKRQRFLGNLKAGSDRSGGAAGFFWEDPSELKYLHKLRIKDSASTTSSDADMIDPDNAFSSIDELDPEDDFEEKDEDEIWESVKLQGSLSRRDIIPLNEDEKLLWDSAEEFSSFFDGASDEHVRRSNAVKRTWSDPKWRAEWYQKRWGNRPRPLTAESKKRRNAEARLHELDAESIVENEALGNMSGDKISKARPNGRNFLSEDRIKSKSSQCIFSARRLGLPLQFFCDPNSI